MLAWSWLIRHASAGKPGARKIACGDGAVSRSYARSSAFTAAHTVLAAKQVDEQERRDGQKERSIARQKEFERKRSACSRHVTCSFGNSFDSSLPQLVELTFAMQATVKARALGPRRSLSCHSTAVCGFRQPHDLISARAQRIFRSAAAAADFVASALGGARGPGKGRPDPCKSHVGNSCRP